MSLVRLAALACVLICLPQVSSAAVTISEVAWMGTTLSANHEWIELYNDGGSEVVDGWVLTDGMNLTIPLSGTIPAQSYAVLERTSDDSAAGSAFLVYTGALVNSGATLSLRRGDDSLVDQVAGGENWENIGGDNVTKETGQYTAIGWVTAVPTPGAQNTTDTNSEDEDEDEDNEEIEEEENDSEDTTGGGGSTVSRSRTATPEPLKTEPSAPTIKISMEGQVYVNQPVTAKATIGNIGKTVAQSMVREWNFGDMHTATGETVTHRFAYPGEYIVSVTATYKDFVAKDRVVVTVLPLTLSVTKNTAGDVQLHNDAKYEVDVSGYTVAAERTVTIPTGTFMRPKATLTIPRTALGATYRPVLVYDSARHLVAHEGSRETAVAKSTLAIVGAASPGTVAPIGESTPSREAFRFGGSATSAPVAPSAVPALNQPANQPAPVMLEAAVAASSGAVPWYPYLGLLAVIGIGLAAVVAGRAPVATPQLVNKDEVDVDDFPFR